MKVEQSPPPLKRKGHDKYTNEDLPDGAQDQNIWRRIVIPTFVMYIAGRKDIWSVKDEEAVVSLQKIWDHVYVNSRTEPNEKKIEHTIKISCAVYSIVSLFPPCVFIHLVHETHGLLYRLASAFLNGVVPLALLQF